MKTESEILQMLEGIPVVSSHEHHLETPAQQALDLDGIFRRSYVGWCSLPASASPADRAAWLDSIRANSYFIWLEKSLDTLYGCGPVTAANWDALSEKIRAAHRDPSYHWEVLRRTAGYRRMVEDSYWNPGGCAGNPEMAASAYRMDCWMAGFHPSVRDHDQMNPVLLLGKMPETFDAYLAAIRQDIARHPQACAFKCAAAYERSLRFSPVSRAEAEAVYGKSPACTTPDERTKFGDFVFSYFLQLAEELDFPVQIHTGLARLSGSSPMLLEPAIAAHPGVKFVLFHGGFPWFYEIAALAHNHRNVYLDLNWIPLVSTEAAKSALHTFLEILPDSSHLSWGGDTWTSEEAYGALLALRHVMASVFAEKRRSGLYSASLVERLSEKILWENAQKLYRL